jgi:hypothetical protein
MLALTNRSIELMDQLADASGNVFRMNRRGYVYFTADPGRLSRMQESAAAISAAGGGPLRVHEASPNHYHPADTDGYQNALGGADLLLGEAAVRRAFPYVTEAAVAALHVRRAGWLSAGQACMHWRRTVAGCAIQEYALTASRSRR